MLYNQAQDIYTWKAMEALPDLSQLSSPEKDSLIALLSGLKIK